MFFLINFISDLIITVIGTYFMSVVFVRKHEESKERKYRKPVFNGNKIFNKNYQYKISYQDYETYDSEITHTDLSFDSFPVPCYIEELESKEIENQIKETKSNYTHWSKNSKIYDYIVSDRRLRPGVYEPFILIIGNVKDGLDKNKIFELGYENYPSSNVSKKYYKEEEIIAPMNNENIEKVFLVYDRNDKNKWVDVTNLLLKK